MRSDFVGLFDAQPNVGRVIAFDRKQGLGGLVKQAWTLARAGYTHVYDAHNNLRSRLIGVVFLFASLLYSQSRRPPPKFIRRSKQRLRRWAYFRLRWKVLPTPYRGAESYHRPLARWGLPATVPPGPQLRAKTFLPADVEREVAKLPRPWVVLAPSAAWEMKRWPIEHWQKLMAGLSDVSFLLVGGKDDTFIEGLARPLGARAVNLAGRLSLAETTAVIQTSDLVIANDTGSLHVADQLERPTIALIGPTAFGYPSHTTSHTLEIELPCKPCSKDGRGKCVNDLYKRCLIEVTPDRVATKARELLSGARK